LNKLFVKIAIAVALLSPLAEPAHAAASGDVLAEASRWLGSANMTGFSGPWCADAVSFWLRRT